MLTGRLFAGLAGVLAVLAFFTRVRLLPPMNLYLHVTHIVLSPYSWQLFGALVCASFAFIYFAAAQWMARPLNQSIGLFGFAFIALAFIVWLILGFFIGDSRHSIWQIGALFGAIFGFIFGCALFAVNAAWTLFTMFRAQSAFR